MSDQIEWDVISIYRSLWEHNDHSRHFIIFQDDLSHPFGIIHGDMIVAPEVDAEALLQVAIQRGSYPAGSFLVEMVEDFDNLAEGADIN